MAWRPAVRHPGAPVRAPAPAPASASGAVAPVGSSRAAASSVSHDAADHHLPRLPRAGHDHRGQRREQLLRSTESLWPQGPRGHVSTMSACPARSLARAAERSSSCRPSLMADRRSDAVTALASGPHRLQPARKCGGSPMTRRSVSDPIWIPPYSSPEEPWGPGGAGRPKALRCGSTRAPPPARFERFGHHRRR